MRKVKYKILLKGKKIIASNSATEKVADLQQGNRKKTAAVKEPQATDRITPQLYKELKSRSKRCKDLQRVCSKLKTKQDLQVSSTPPV